MEKQISSLSEIEISAQDRETLSEQKASLQSLKPQTSLENISPNSNNDSQSSEKQAPSENSTETQICQELTLKHVKSKEEIEEQAKESEEMISSLNSNIDDLFRKISSLTEQVSMHLPQKSSLEDSALIPPENQDSTRSSERTAVQLEEAKGQDEPQEKPVQLKEQRAQQTASNSVLQTDLNSPVFFSNFGSQPLTQNGLNMRLFQTGKSVGFGKFGEVVLCRNKETGNLYAMKKIFKSLVEEYQMQSQLLQELKILSLVSHPNIVKGFAAFTDEFHIFALTEFIQGDILTKKFKCGEAEAKLYIKQILEAVKYLHQNGICHRDIKAQNIIVSETGVIKLCDFGWACQTQTQQMDILCGTLDYVTPEMAQKQPYTKKTDLWNIGVLTFELIFGMTPFKAASRSQIFEKVSSITYEFPEYIEGSQECLSFIRGFLQPQQSRQSIEWGLQHEFLKGIQEKKTSDLFLNLDEVEKVLSQ